VDGLFALNTWDVKVCWAPGCDGKMVLRANVMEHVLRHMNRDEVEVLLDDGTVVDDGTLERWL
jgi:hypothetical protein